MFPHCLSSWLDTFLFFHLREHHFFRKKQQQKNKSGSLKLCQNCFAPCLQSDHCMVYTAPCGGGRGWPDRYSLCNMALFFLQVCLAEKVLWLALLQCFFKRALWNFACVLIANGLWNCLLLSKCLRTHDITQKNDWVGLIPFLPLIRLVFLVSDCRICSFYFWEIELSVLATRLLQTLKWEGADCRQGPSSVQPANPPLSLPPSTFTVRLLFFFRQSYFYTFLPQSFSQFSVPAGSDLEHTDYFSYNFRCTVSPQHGLWGSDL